MTEQNIDPKYILDEIEILTMVVDKLAIFAGIKRTSDGTTVVAEMKDVQNIRDLLDELEKRKKTRNNPNTSPVGGREVSPWKTVDHMIDAMRKMPTTEAINAIIAADIIREDAQTRGIAKALIHTAVSPEGAAEAEKRAREAEEMSPEDYDRYLDEISPKLPEPLRTEWQAQRERITQNIADLDEADRIQVYASYLKNSLDRLALDEGVVSCAEGKPNREWQDQFWVRNVVITDLRVQPGQPQTPSQVLDTSARDVAQAIEQSTMQEITEQVDREIVGEMIKAQPYHISIEFVPAITKSEDESLIVYSNDEALPQRIRERLPLAHIDEPFVAAHYHKGELMTVDAGSTPLHAKVRVAAALPIPERKKPPLPVEAAPSSASALRLTMNVLWESYIKHHVHPKVKRAVSENRMIAQILAPHWVVKTWREAYGDKATMLGHPLGMNSVDEFEVELAPILPEVVDPTLERCDRCKQPLRGTGSVCLLCGRQNEMTGKEARQFVQDMADIYALRRDEQSSLRSEIASEVDKLTPEKQRELLKAIRKYEKTNAKGFWLTVIASDPGRPRQSKWWFATEARMTERAHLLSSLCRLRGGETKQDSRDSHDHYYYKMPYTWDELVTIFGPMEELT